MKRKKENLPKKILSRFLLANKNLLFRSIHKTMKPRWLWLETTDMCNSKCTHCSIWKKPITKNQLTAQEIKKALKDPLFSELESIINSGGEAILRKDIEEIIMIEYELFPKISIDISTNGLLPDRMLKITKSVLKKGVKINIGISLDGIGKAHDKIRGVDGNFQKADYLIEELMKLREKYPKKLSIIIGFTLSDLTVDYFKDVKDYAEKRDIEFSAQWYNQSSFYDNSEKKQNNKNEKIMQAVQSLPDTIHKNKWIKKIKNKPIKFMCFAGYTFCALRCDGNIVPCLNLWDSIMGNVKESTPSQIWESKKTKLIRKNQINKCSGCLNSWGVWWSIGSCFYPRLAYYLKNPKSFLKRIKEK